MKIKGTKTLREVFDNIEIDELDFLYKLRFQLLSLTKDDRVIDSNIVLTYNSRLNDEYQSQVFTAPQAELERAFQTLIKAVSLNKESRG